MRPSTLLEIENPFVALTLDDAAAAAGLRRDHEEFRALCKAGIYTAPPWMR